MSKKVAVERRSHARELLPLTNGSVSARPPASDGVVVYSTVWNLSRGGACLLLPRGGGEQLLRQGDAVFTDALVREVSLLVRVVWIEDLGRSFFVGVAFDPSPLPMGTILDPFLHDS
jgi:hypothetical protein